VNTSTECERVRIALMASLDGESDQEFAPDRQHLSTCVSCRRWLNDLQSMTGALQGLSYPNVPVDLWTAVEGRIRRPEQALPRWMWPVVGMMLGWRALQLFVDLPILVPHLIVPLVVMGVAVWLSVGDHLRIETSAPELRNRGV
jgi:predicted anti-sigma-YlaC factor YlaD